MATRLLLALLFTAWTSRAWKCPAGVRLLGRFSTDRERDSDSFSADWPGSGIAFRVKPDAAASELSVTMSYECPAAAVGTRTETEAESNCHLHFFVALQVNGDEFAKFEISDERRELSVSIPLSRGREAVELRLVKITETACGDAYGIMRLGALDVKGGQVVPVEETKQKKLLVVGDSITAAYGVDGNMPCVYSAATQDVTHGYAYLVAKAIDAEVDTIAWSGKGVVRNYGDVNQMSADPMPNFYNRTLATIAATSTVNNYWEPGRFKPDMVIIALGTNDFSTEPSPSEDMFVSGYLNLIAQIKIDYPKVPLLGLCAPLNTGNQCLYTQHAATQGDINYFAVPVNTMIPGYGCDYHPNKESQQKIAEAVTPIVKNILKI